MLQIHFIFVIILSRILLDIEEIKNENKYINIYYLLVNSFISIFITLILSI
jgi:hypothetical protein